MHNIYQYLNNPVETFFVINEKIQHRRLPILREAEVTEAGERRKKVRSIRALQDSYIQHQVLLNQLPWVSTVCEKWTLQNCSIKYGHKKLLSSSPVQVGVPCKVGSLWGGWWHWWPLGAPFPGSARGPAPGPHLQSQSLASRVHCCHSGGPRSPLRSHSWDPWRRGNETTERGGRQTCRGQWTQGFKTSEGNTTPSYCKGLCRGLTSMLWTLNFCLPVEKHL